MVTNPLPFDFSYPISEIIFRFQEPFGRLAGI